MFIKQKINKGQKYELNRCTNKIWFIFVLRSCTRFFNRGARMAQWVRSLDLTAHTSPSPIRCGFAPNFVNYKKGCTRFAAARDKVYQLLAQDRWFSPGTPVSSTTKTGRHDIAEILLKVALKHKKKQSINLQQTVGILMGISCTSPLVDSFLYLLIILLKLQVDLVRVWRCRRGRMAVWFTTTYVISSYRH